MKKTILLLISHSCNLNCKYCYEKFKAPKRMTWEQARLILEEEFSDGFDNIESIDLLGGEPLSNFPIIPQICSWVWNHSPEIRFFSRTNGTLLTDEMKAWFIEHKERFTLGLSIDGTPETNRINRGVANLDIEFFQEYWPENPVKMTIFPDSVKLLFESLHYLYGRGLDVTGGLAQGVRWDDNSCVELKKQLDSLCEFYIDNPSVSIMKPLFDLDFHRAFWMPESPEDADPPCWSVANIHTYDCDGELLPCHMFSRIVQGDGKRKTILDDSLLVEHELLPNECMQCPIRWCCKNCMAMNYQHTGLFEKNINLELMCKAQKVVAYASAYLLLNQASRKEQSLEDKEYRQSVSNAIKYVRLIEEHGFQ